MGLDDASARERKYLVVTANAFVAYFAPMQFAAETGENVGGWRVLSVAECDHRLTRIGPRRFELEAVGGTFMASVTEEMTRAPEAPFLEGEVVDLHDVRVEILRLGRGGLPDLMGVELKAPGELPELWASVSGKMEPLRLGVGDSVDLPFVQPL
jgi:hypothetical protein